ncbi:hypothetical protein N7508_001727 [Penicillium antarcticum]|uniref:uncharacterized protein n=1 Tax=Penicillium antarcticum TaxID=416450 RepID=UPI00238B5EF8|nr:uncharacterized protein N7508_001727 [Penicillium antarcticum]KAJ5317219.1 hypothetical protein N7508_001727 [Penicillium antarcticum]
MAKPSLSPAQWRQACRAINPNVHGVCDTRLSARAAPAINNVTAATTTKRPFYTTQPRSIAGGRKTPHLHNGSLQRATSRVLKSKQGVHLDRDGFFNLKSGADVAKVVREFQDSVKETYEAASSILPPGIGLTSFKSVGERLLKAIHAGHPSAAAIQSISIGNFCSYPSFETTVGDKSTDQWNFPVIDVDAVYRIGHVVAGRNFVFREWIQSACAKAGSRRAVVFLVSRYMRLDGIDIHRNNEWTTQVQELALKEDFPPALLVWAELLTWRGQTKEASKILEERVLPFVQSTRSIPKPWTDLTLDGTVSSPWRLYALANADDTEKVKEAINRAALEFGEPVALTELAIDALANRQVGDDFIKTFMDTDKNAWEAFEKYEQYMSMAATAGHDKACFYLANWYYLISQGWIDSPEARATKIRTRDWEMSRQDDWNNPWKKYNPFFLIPMFFSRWNKPMERSEYRKLSMDWHELALQRGDNPSSALILALLFREDGLMDESRKMYDQAAAFGLPMVLPRKGLIELEDNWDNPEYTPPMKKIAVKLMRLF